VDFLAKLDSQLESLLYNYIRNIPMKTKPSSCVPYYLKTSFSDKAEGIREPLCYVVALPDAQNMRIRLRLTELNRSVWLECPERIGVKIKR
jgi:hypothetical protein